MTESTDPLTKLPELLGPSPMQIQHYLDEGVRKIEEDNQTSRAYIGISGVGDCKRAQWFRAVRGADPQRYPVPPHPPHTLRLFRDGHIYEEEFVTRMNRSGLQITDQQREVRWPHPDLQETVRGHMDGRFVVPTEWGLAWSVLECKRVGGAQSLKKTGSVAAAWPHMVRQLSGYMYCSESPLGLLLISDKSDRDMAIYESWYQLHDGLVHDLDSGEPVVSVDELEARILQVEYARRADQPPPRDYDPRGKDWQCRYCDDKDNCLEMGR